MNNSTNQTGEYFKGSNTNIQLHYQYIIMWYPFNRYNDMYNQFFLNRILVTTVGLWSLLVENSWFSFYTCVNSSAFPSGSRANIAGRPDLLSVYLIPALSKISFNFNTSLIAIQVWRSRPPCSGRPVNGSGFGSSIKWIISEPTQSQAPL